MSNCNTKVVGSILQGPAEMSFHTDMRKVLLAFGGREREFDWAVNDFEGYPMPVEFIDGDEPILLSGDELSDLVARPDSPHQIIWGVFSGWLRSLPSPPGVPDKLPAADGNGDFWKADLQLQWPGAVVEIVCFDSSLTLLITTDADLTERFRRAFPSAQDLAAQNLERRVRSPKDPA